MIEGSTLLENFIVFIIKYSELLKSLLFIFPSLIAIFEGKNAIVLSRESKFKSLTIKKTDFLSKTFKEKSSKKSEEFQELFDKFIKIFNEKFPHVDKAIFDKNLETLSTKKINFSEKEFTLSKLAFATASGYYMPLNNTLVSLDKENIFFHEMLHVATAIHNYEDCREYVGFNQDNNNINLAVGLNEGYTELLTCRMLDKDFSSGYEIEKKVAGLLEIIVGRERMEQLYFKADLYNLNEDLKQYADEKEILIFLHNLDFICENKIGGVAAKVHQQEKMKKIQYFLSKTYLNKLLESEDKIKAEEEYYKYLDILNSEFKTNIDYLDFPENDSKIKEK